MTNAWWKGAAELAPGALSTDWPKPEIPDGKVLCWTSFALRLRISGLDLGSTDEVVAAARLSACVRENSFIEARVGGDGLLVVRADEIPSPFGIAAPIGMPADVAASRPFKDVTLSGRPIRVRRNDGLSFKLGFDDRECKCPEPHSRAVRLELSINGTLEEA